MSMYWYPGESRFEIAVDDPGHGRLDIRRLDECATDWLEVRGERLGLLAREVLAAALEDRAPVLPYPLTGLGLTREDARAMAAALQRAALLAAAGTDRYERIHADPEDPPAEPLCTSCNLGSPYSGEVTISERCTEYGHWPFGARAATTWDAAQREYLRTLGARRV